MAWEYFAIAAMAVGVASIVMSIFVFAKYCEEIQSLAARVDNLDSKFSKQCGECKLIEHIKDTYGPKEDQ